MSVPTPRSEDSSPFDTYPVRVMLGLVASLILMLGLVHLPIPSSVPRVGLSAHPSAEQITLADVRAEESEEGDGQGKGSSSGRRTLASAPPTTDVHSSSPEDPSPTEAVTNSSGPTQDSPQTERYEKIQSVSELSLTDRTPYIVGGVGSLYLHIQYPSKAIQQGIEGELALEFTVQRDGNVADLEVVKSLHPSCDSAAIAGVRSVQFVPAKHNGEPIPIRLRLPVEFRLTAATSSALPKGRTP